MTQDKNIVEVGDDSIDYTTFKWNLTNVCNYECSYCNAIPVHGFHVKSFNKVTGEKRNSWKNVIKRLSLKHVGQFDIQILGGEPTLHPGFGEIITNLDQNQNCREVEVYTNLSRPIKYFSKLSLRKVILLPAYHSEYYTSKFLEKVQALHGKGINIQPVINLSTDRKHWPEIKHIIHTCKSGNIDYRLNFLHEVSEPINFTPKYTQEFWDEFHEILIEEWKSLAKINSGPLSSTADIPSDKSSYTANYLRDLYTAGREISVTYKDGTTKTLLENEVTKQNILNFYKWHCRARIYYINHEGVIYNECTKQILPIYFTEADLSGYKICPQGSCDRMSFIYYNKLHYHRKKKL